MPNDQLPEDFRQRFMALHTALFCDSMDRMGLDPQVMDHRIRPMYPGAVIVGRALPVLWAPVYRSPEHPYEHLFEAYRALEEDDVFVMTTSGFATAGVWGGLLATAARAQGAVGTIIDGLTRDVDEIEEIEFPVFALGRSAKDSEGRAEAIEFGTPIECGGALVNRGDIVFADDMGGIVIPAAAAAEVLERAEEKNRGESDVRKILAAGRDVGEVFREYGIL
ncbi:MAG: RraA family protein [Chloroflexota bacterium]|jgi:regulator of RNase E activity RraA|nr:RraA family protein [Chloroflexota bacterium]MDP6758865.1 RraA family protein [Chloroflexota bacterium]